MPVLAIVVILFAIKAHAEEQPIDAAARPLIADLERMTGRAIVKPFRMARVSPEQIFSICKCRATGLFLSGDLGIVPAVDLNTSEGQAVLFHELAHALQWSERGDATECEEFLKREAEALVLERRWRMEHGARLPPLPFYTCTQKQ